MKWLFPTISPGTPLFFCFQCRTTYYSKFTFIKPSLRRIHRDIENVTDTALLPVLKSARKEYSETLHATNHYGRSSTQSASSAKVAAQEQNIVAHLQIEPSSTAEVVASEDVVSRDFQTATSALDPAPESILSSKHNQNTASSTYPLPKKSKLPTKPARTRFAPSPTGSLHLGSLRTALFSFLLARATGGQFILRIEDTDAKRTVPGAEEGIIRDLLWAGLEWDEGPEFGSDGTIGDRGQLGPYRQSKRSGYKPVAERLIQSGAAYRCFCTPQMIQAKSVARGQQGHVAEYDGSCLAIPADESDKRAKEGESYSIRLKDPHRKYHDVESWEDLVLGKMKPRSEVAKQNAGRDAWNDAVLLKSNGTPTYHLASVVDDHEMQITHVIRGNEWLESTWLHLAIYKALKWKPPYFAHVGLLLDGKRAKMSKRDGFGLNELKERYLPAAVINHLATMGWKQPKRIGKAKGLHEVWTMAELIEHFDMNLNKSSPIVTFEKLKHFQACHVKVARNNCNSKEHAALMRLLQKAFLARYSPDLAIHAGIFTHDDFLSRVSYVALHHHWKQDLDEFIEDNAAMFGPVILKPFEDVIPEVLKADGTNKRNATIGRIIIEIKSLMTLRHCIGANHLQDTIKVLRENSIQLSSSTQEEYSGCKPSLELRIEAACRAVEQTLKGHIQLNVDPASITNFKKSHGQVDSTALVKQLLSRWIGCKIACQRSIGSCVDVLGPAIVLLRISQGAMSDYLETTCTEQDFVDIEIDD